MISSLPHPDWLVHSSLPNLFAPSCYRQLLCNVGKKGTICWENSLVAILQGSLSLQNSLGAFMVLQFLVFPLVAIGNCCINWGKYPGRAPTCSATPTGADCNLAYFTHSQHTLTGTQHFLIFSSGSKDQSRGFI